ncbi:hypothetical protein K491DRAFT_399807 [Lophiostoma macrostomum CBS 122681]|uniref:Uncharacterized protein n=1 Tax=Lophiostoma macrostomum CBS 122681 TaxID=1314788 RepID=A0A6A6T8V3_9PLEO|nr:hypothetical protein K491DRAFT_399807 [Lophiostoma macrostomum CBS 122681]
MRDHQLTSISASTTTSLTPYLSGTFITGTSAVVSMKEACFSPFSSAIRYIPMHPRTMPGQRFGQSKAITCSNHIDRTRCSPGQQALHTLRDYRGSFSVAPGAQLLFGALRGISQPQFPASLFLHHASERKRLGQQREAKGVRNFFHPCVSTMQNPRSCVLRLHRTQPKSCQRLACVCWCSTTRGRTRYSI